MADVSETACAGIILIKRIKESLTYGMSKSDVKALREEIETFKSIIEEADEKLEEDVPEKAWMNQMRGVSELIEDFFDANVMAAEAPVVVPRGFADYLDSLAGKVLKGAEPNITVNGAELATEIKKINALLLGIKERAEKKSNERIPDRDDHGAWNAHERNERVLVSLLLSDWPPVGNIGHTMTELTEKILGGDLDQSTVVIIGSDRYSAISITALAERVYKVAEKKFELCCRIRVPWANDDMNELVRLMMKQVNAVGSGKERTEIDAKSDGKSTGFSVDEYEGMSDEELVSTLRRSLRSNKYLVVFDHVCNKKVWDVMRDVLPDDNTGSRIIITNRQYENVSYKSVRMEPLSEAMSRDLFYGIAFFDEPEQRCPPELEQLSLEVIRMCEGFSFAIVAIASLLSTKAKIPQEWKKILDNLILEAERDERLRCLFEILESLRLRALPPPIKHCFLHFTAFPKGSLFNNDQLVKLWIAEGFVQEKAGQTLEEVAKKYLKELTNRNLVQACQGFYGIDEFSRVKSLMHEVGRKKASERYFCQIWDGKDSSFRGNSRRLLICDGTVEQVLESIEVDSRIRTVVISNTVAPGNSALLTLFQQCKILTLLVIENTPIELIPEEVGNLLCLKYLSMKKTKVKTLPKSVGKLHKLQTLDLTSTLLVELPKEIFKLQSLRHLLASRCDNEISISSAKGVQIKGGIKYLVNLQTLMTVEAHLSGMLAIQELKRLTKLRSLSVSRLTRELARALCASIEVMRQLESLRLHSINNQILDLQAISSPPLHLERLVLKGLLQKLPHWISGLQNLNMLCLSHSGLVDDPLQHLYSLPNLESLWLYRAYDGERLHFPQESFKKLKLLVLRDLQRLEMVEIEEGSLLLLEELRVGPSPLLNEVPSGFKHLRNLKVVSFYDMSKEFVLGLKPDGGSEYWKLEHVPSVLFHYKDEGRRYTSYKLGETDLLNHLEGLDANINDVNERDIRLSFCYSDEEEDSDLTPTSQWNDIPSRLSFSSDRFSFFTDDVEE